MKHANRFSISYKNSPFKAGARGWRKTRVRLSLPTKLEERTARDLAHATRHTERRSPHALLRAARAAHRRGLVNPSCAEAEPRQGQETNLQLLALLCYRSRETTHLPQQLSTWHRLAQGWAPSGSPTCCSVGFSSRTPCGQASNARGCADCHHLPSAQRGGRCRGAPLRFVM